MMDNKYAKQICKYNYKCSLVQKYYISLVKNKNLHCQVCINDMPVITIQLKPISDEH